MFRFASVYSDIDWYNKQYDGDDDYKILVSILAFQTVFWAEPLASIRPLAANYWRFRRS